MKKTLLYFEEYHSYLSDALLKREDINVIFLRPTLKFMTKEYLDKTKNIAFCIDRSDNLESQMMRFLEWLKNKNVKVDYFLNDSEYYMELANFIARKMKLDALSEEQVKWVRDKVSMKDKFRSIGLQTVDYKAVDSYEEVKDYFIKNNGHKIVFKPRDGMNSKDTYIISSLEDIDKLAVKMKPNKYMVETYTSDHEWSIEALVQDGVVLDSYLTYIPESTIIASINGRLNCHMQLLEPPKYFKIHPKEYIQKIIDGMELKNGAMTIEVFISKDGNIKASEMGWRFPGCQTTMNISISRGFSIFDALIDIAIKKKVKLEYKNNITVPGDIYLPNKEGTIEDFTSLEELSEMDGFVMGELYVKRGKYQSKRRVGTDASGWVIVEGNTPEETMRYMQNIYENFRITTIEERTELNECKLVKTMC